MDPESLRILTILDRPLTDQREYARRLAGNADEYVRIGGIVALLNLGVLPPHLWEVAIAEARHGAVAASAFKFFTANLEYEMAERVVEAFGPHDRSEAAVEMRAVLAMQSALLVDIHARRFLADGHIDHLMSAAEQAQSAAGWRAALIWLARATVLQPVAPAGIYRLLRVLETANQFDAIGQVLDILASGGVFPEVRSVFKAVLLLRRKDPEGALQSLSQLRTSEMRSGASVRARVCQIRAEACEALAQYPDALKWYQELNRQDVPQGLDKRAYLATIERLARFDVPALSPDTRRSDFMMLGFPRSGTTLLEQALAAHPEIETFEEIPSVTRMVLFIERLLQEPIAEEEQRRGAFEQARRRYYDEIDRRKAKAGARVFVDKLPIRTAWIEVLEKLFPDKRYIFSIRHPYDVVLSCFKQSFTPNAAMENFRTLEDSCAFYDRVMSIWFKVFAEENDRVLYVRYDELVNEFEPEVMRVLAFLGVDWSDDVLRFAELSEQRGAATPSYGKVRSGLGIGIQSSWKNYRFVFDTSHGAKLHKWVDRFGYER